MHAYRMFFTVLISCVSFIAVMFTIAGVGFAIVTVTGAEGDEPWEALIYLGTIVLFFVFMRQVSRVLGDVTKDLDHDEASTDEARTMHELHHGLLRMDQRIESLETILFDRAKRDDSAHAGRR